MFDPIKDVDLDTANVIIEHNATKEENLFIPITEVGLPQFIEDLRNQYDTHEKQVQMCCDIAEMFHNRRVTKINQQIIRMKLGLQ